MSFIYKVTSKDFDNKGEELVTSKLQALLDLASQNNGTLVIPKGKYLTSSLFVKSHTTLIFKDGAQLIGTTDESKYELINTRVAGVEMKWYPGILNVISSEDVTIKGKGIIDGQGEYYYKKYWGEDTKGGMREEYDKKGLRWACDYDCLRVRNILVQDSNNVVIDGLTSLNSGFWNLHVLYSHEIKINDVNVISENPISPSTDGIDIDSSYDVEISKCTTSTNDDSICIKSGRDYDGLRVNRPSHDIKISNCRINKGFGITIGSEVSGGIYNVSISNIDYKDTDCGFRIKSAPSRKGYIKNISISNLSMLNVKYVFNIFLDWNPSYSKCKLPKGYKEEISPRWESLLKEVDSKIPNTEVSGLHFENIYSTYDKKYEGVSRAFNIVGFSDSHIKDISFKNMYIKSKEYGIINNADDVQMTHCKVDYLKDIDHSNDSYDNR